MISGFLYWGYNDWADWGLGFLALNVIAVIHTLGAFAILTFLIIHLYMTTTGHKVTAHVRAMITGWEEMPDEEPKEVVEDAIGEMGHKILSNGSKNGNNEKEAKEIMVEALGKLGQKAEKEEMTEIKN